MEHNKDNKEAKSKTKIEKRIKSVFVGNATVGKKHVIWTLHNGHCPTDYVPGWQDNYIFEASNDDLAVDIELWTVGGTDEYAKLRVLSYPYTEIFLVCFSVADRTSFNDIKTTWIPEISQHCPNVPFLLIGCKTDLRDDTPDPEAVRTSQLVTSGEGEELALQIGAVKYFECSSVKNRGLKEIMHEVAKIVLELREKTPDSGKKKDKERCSMQ